MALRCISKVRSVSLGREKTLKYFPWLCLTFLGFVLGCGGGGGAPRPPVSATPSVSVDWPTRTRNVEAPNSALSATFRLRSTTTAQDVETVSANRAVSLSAHTETYAFPSAVPVGTYTLTGTFYAGVGQTGAIVATVSSPVRVSSSGALQKPDGTALGEIAFAGIIKSVAIAPNQSVLVAQQLQLVVTAFDANSNPVAVAPGSFDFSVVGGSSFASVTPDGIVTGVAAGSASAVASIDGLTSAPVPVIVSAPPAHVFRFARTTDSIQLTGGTLQGACPLATRFTIEAFVRPTGGDGNIWQQWTDGQMDERLGVSSGDLQATAFDNFHAASLALPLNQWSHVAWCYDGTNFQLYQNGALVLSEPTTSDQVRTAMANACALGYNNSSLAAGTNLSFLGDIAGFRISNNLRYTGSSFTPPSLPLTSDSSTLLLIDPYSSTTSAAPTSFGAPGLQGLTATLGGGGVRATSPSWALYTP